MFRALELHALGHSQGQAYLHSMPGRFEPLDRTLTELDHRQIELVICLARDAEISHKSPSYAEAIVLGTFPVERIAYPITDYGVPTQEQLAEFLALVNQVAARLQQGAGVLIHCAAGIGRTGIFATALLMSLGLDKHQAKTVSAAAGASPDTAEQDAFLDWVEEIIAKR